MLLVFADLTKQRNPYTSASLLTFLGARCLIDLTDNKIKGIATELCSIGKWMYNAVTCFGCDAILCKSGQYNSKAIVGRVTHPPKRPLTESSDAVGTRRAI